MLTILFVDDEPNILQEIQRATRIMRDAWDMHFAESRDEGLALMGRNAMDVVVSGMRMQGLDGTQFLSRVRAEQPSAARIMLCGYSDEEAVFRSTQVAHQFLSKPVDLEELKRTIEQVRSATASVDPDSVRALVGKMEQLPALGEVYTELSTAIQRDTSTNDSLARIVSKDTALTAHLLRLVNSAFFGLTREVESVGQAIGFLGIDVVRAIVAGHSLFSSDVPGIDIRQIAEESQTVGALARLAVRQSGGSAIEASQGYLAGTLHQVGSLVLGSQTDIDPTELRAVLMNGDLRNERLVLGSDRYAAGAYLLGLWGFAPAIIDAVRLLADKADPTAHRITWAVRIARETVETGRARIQDVDDQGDYLTAMLTEAAAELAANGFLSRAEVAA